MKILIVDDQPINLKLLQAQLRAEGHTVIAVANGVEALVVLERAQVDAIISDILMPQMDGFRLCYEVRKSPRLQAIPFIFYTATYTSPGDEKLCLELGGDKYLRKPGSLEEITTALRETTNAARQRRPNRVESLSETNVMKEFNARLVSKLEEKHIELQQTLEKLQVAHDEMLESEERFRQIAATIDEVFWITNPNITRMLYVSPAYERVWGRSIASLYENPRSFLESIHSGDREAVLAGLELQKTGQSFDHEYRIVRPDGAVRWIWDRGFPVRDEAGQIIRFLGVAVDITEHKDLEEQFRQAQKMEAVGRLAGGVAHDFNNLLTVINGYSEMVLDGLESSHPSRRYLEEIKKAGAQAASLTRQLLAFSRQQVLAPQVLDLNILVTDLKIMLRRLIGEDIDLVLVRDPAPGRVKADPGQINQILINLAINARDAMPQGGKLTIETSNVLLDEAYADRHIVVPPGRYVMLMMSDTGIGMDAEIQTHIFEPFFTTKEKGQGTGLGLAMVYGTVKQSGGFIWVYSEPGRGTTFKIYLPRVEEVGISEQPSEARVHSAGGTETILLVEDEQAVRTLATRILQASGYKVLESMSSEDALQIGERYQESIDLLLTDVVLPRMGGRMIAEHLVLLRPGMKVLYMSGYTDDAVVRHGVLESNTAFLQKPFTPAALANKVREVLDAGH